jgi:asparagine synthase (glutamine-hydrolysing)
MREPFLDKDVIETAMNTSIKLKVFDGNDSLGKRVHRLLAVELGIPKDVAYRIKEAAQHGSGLHETLDSIARKNGFHQMVIPTLVKAELQKREKLGSSQRYGYMFDDHDKWNNKLYVQVFLDNLCNKIPQLAPLFVD